MLFITSCFDVREKRPKLTVVPASKWPSAAIERRAGSGADAILAAEILETITTATTGTVFIDKLTTTVASGNEPCLVLTQVLIVEVAEVVVEAVVAGEQKI